MDRSTISYTDFSAIPGNLLFKMQWFSQTRSGAIAVYSGKLPMKWLSLNQFGNKIFPVPLIRYLAVS